MDAEDDLVLSEDESASDGQASFVLSPNSKHGSREDLGLAAAEEEDVDDDDYTVPSGGASVRTGKNGEQEDDEYTLDDDHAHDDEEASQGPAKTPPRVETSTKQVQDDAGDDDDEASQYSAYSEGFASEASGKTSKHQEEHSGYASDFQEASTSRAPSPVPPSHPEEKALTPSRKSVEEARPTASSGVRRKEGGDGGEARAGGAGSKSGEATAGKGEDSGKAPRVQHPPSVQGGEGEGARTPSSRLLRSTSSRRGKDGDTKREIELLTRQLREVENLLANPTDPNSMLLQRIRVRREVLHKRHFLSANLKRVDAELEKVGEARTRVEANIQKRVQDIERRKQEEEEHGLRVMEEELFELSSRAVEGGRRNLELSRKLVAVKTDERTVVADVTYARSLLRKSIGRRAETDESMPLSTLLGIYDDLVRAEKEAAEAEEERSNETGTEARQEDPQQAKRLLELEREVREAQLENAEVEARIAAAEAELGRAATQFEDVHALKAKVGSVKQRYLAEKEERRRAHKIKQGALKKLALLSKHIERLMEHIKHEAVAKARAQAYKRKTFRERDLLRERGRELLSSMQEREALIVKLEHCARLLEDQLKLMDSRYLQLRAKLHHTKQSSEAQVRRAQQEVDGLVARWRYVKSLLPEGPMDPSELRTRLHSLTSRASTAAAAAASLGYGNRREGPCTSDGAAAPPLPAIYEVGSPLNPEYDGAQYPGPPTAATGGPRGRRRVAQYDYPNLSEVIKDPELGEEDEERRHLWSQARIDRLYTRLRHYHKAPVKHLA